MNRTKLLIEVGAFDGSDSIRYWQNGFRVFTFEPKEDLYNALSTKMRGKPDYTVIKKAVSLTNGPLHFNICKAGGASSILPFKDDTTLNQFWGTNRQDIHYSGTSYTVDSIRLDTFLEQQSLVGVPIDYLHVDAQGADLDVLKSIGQYVSQIQAGVIESAYTSDKAIYAGQMNTVDTASQWLHENGFRVVKITSNDVTNCECNIEFIRV